MNIINILINTPQASKLFKLSMIEFPNSKHGNHGNTTEQTPQNVSINAG